MRYTFRCTRPYGPLGLSINDRVTLDTEHPEYFEVVRHIPADADALATSIADGSIVDEFVERPPEQVEELVYLVNGLPTACSQDRRGHPHDRRGPRLMPP
jgi:hypothetical protein